MRLRVILILTLKMIIILKKICYKVNKLAFESVLLYLKIVYNSSNRFHPKVKRSYKKRHIKHMKIFLKMKNMKNNKMITKGIEDFLKMKAKFGITMED